MNIDLESFPILASIAQPSHIRSFSLEKLLLLAQELRQFLIKALNICGGHFAANLGTVELTLALHYVFQTPGDRLVWDVGHQAYAHKILTGRLSRLHTIRQTSGLAPFPTRQESLYDTFGVGHSSTSISAALGMAVALAAQQSLQKVIAVIGDGAMTAGIAFEALNHAGDIHQNLLVILNDNDMSISENVGGLSRYLTRLLSSPLYTGLREKSKQMLQALPSFWEIARRTEEHLKGLLIPGTLFEELGFNYIGPVDGHDLPLLISTLKNISELKGPQLLHVITQKGKGYFQAEQDPIGYHAVASGFYTEPTKTHTAPPTYSQIFGDWVCDMAEQDPKLVAITPAMREGSGLVRFSQLYPDRYFDVGIAEQHAVTFAAGLACEGMKPVVAIYSTFLQRAYDQLIHDVALQKLPVLFAIDRGGLVGGDGPTHHGSFDLSYLRCIPNLIIMAPSDENECRQMLYTGFLQDQPCAVRYPRGSGTGQAIKKDFCQIPIGLAEIKRLGSKIALLAFGTMLQTALRVAEILDATVVNMRFIKPLDQKLLLSLAQEYPLLVSLEENALMGGAGSAIAEFLNQEAIPYSLLQIGIPDYFPPHGDPKDSLRECGLDEQTIIARCLDRLSRLKTL